MKSHLAQSAAAVVILVRHADRASDAADSPLSSDGVRRARDLTQSLANVKLSAIITTQFIRSSDTGQPIADAQGIRPDVVALNGSDPASVTAHVNDLVTKVRGHPAGAVLVVGLQHGAETDRGARRARWVA